MGHKSAANVTLLQTDYVLNCSAYAVVEAGFACDNLVNPGVLTGSLLGDGIDAVRCSSGLAFAGIAETNGSEEFEHLVVGHAGSLGGHGAHPLAFTRAVRVGEA